MSGLNTALGFHYYLYILCSAMEYVVLYKCLLQKKDIIPNSDKKYKKQPFSNNSIRKNVLTSVNFINFFLIYSILSKILSVTWNQK